MILNNKQDLATMLSMLPLPLRCHQFTDSSTFLNPVYFLKYVLNSEYNFSYVLKKIIQHLD